MQKEEKCPRKISYFVKSAEPTFLPCLQMMFSKKTDVIREEC